MTNLMLMNDIPRSGRELEEQILVYRARLRGSDEGTTLSMKHDLAGTLQDLGEIEGAVELYRAILEVQEETLGWFHPSYLSEALTLASALCKMSEYEEASRLAKLVVEGRESLFGNQNRETVTAKAFYAATLSCLGDYRAASSLQEELVQSVGSWLGKGSHEFAEEVARLKMYQTAAEDTEVEGVQRREKGAEADDQNAGSRADRPVSLVQTLPSAPDEGYAEEITALLDLEAALVAFREESLGLEHVDTLRIKLEQADTLIELGRIAEAKALEQEVLDVRIRTLGPFHTRTRSVMMRVAQSLKNTGDPVGAIEMSRRIVASCIADEQCDDRERAEAMTGLAATLRDGGEVAEAQRVGNAVLVESRRQYGESHPATLVAKEQLAVSYVAGFELELAIPLFQEVYEEECRRFGSESEEVLGVMGKLAMAYSASGDEQRAIECAAEVARIRKKTRGDRHPKTLEADRNFAITLVAAGEYERAEEILGNSITISTAEFGDSHPQTLLLRAAHSLLLVERGESALARSEAEEVLSLAHKTLGRNHTAVRMSYSVLKQVGSKD